MVTTGGPGRLAAGTLAGVVAALTIPSVQPAVARQDPAVRFEVSVRDVRLAPEAAKSEHVVMRHDSGEQILLRNLRVVIDASGLDGIATAEPGFTSSCETADAVITCTRDQEWIHPDGLADFPTKFTAVDGATLGATGTVKVTLTADGVGPVTDTATLTIVEGVNVANATGALSISRTPGEAIDLPLAVRNAGKAPVHGVKLWVSGDHAVSPTTRYSNCEYVGDGAICLFDVTLHPATTYALSTAMAFRLRTDAFAPGFASKEYLWGTPADIDEFAAGWREANPVRGTDPPLTLVARPEVRTSTDQTDTAPEDNWGFVDVEVTGNNPVDLAAVGAQVSGDVGAVVPLTIGVRNLGPATVDWSRAGEAVTHGEFDVPRGASVVAAPRSCVPKVGTDQWDWERPGAPGADAYLCVTGSFLKAGDTETWAFSIRIDAKIPDATGSLAINGDHHHVDDSNPANDTAPVVVNPSGAGGGGGLPVTGANTAWTLGVGALLMVLGVAGYRFGQRRRTNFVA